MNSKSLVAVGAGLILLGSVAAASAKSNQEFLTDAIQGNLVEISMGQLAQKNGGSDGVRSFGQMLVQDHSVANEKATSLAQTQDVTPPTEPKPEAKQEYDRLSKLNGQAFDEKFAKHMVADHKKDIKEFDTSVLSFDDLAAGRVAAVINDTPASVGIIAIRPGLKIVQILETNEKYGFAVSKDKPDLRVAIDNALKAIMTDGTFATIFEKWFHAKPPFPVPITQ